MLGPIMCGVAAMSWATCCADTLDSVNSIFASLGFPKSTLSRLIGQVCLLNDASTVFVQPAMQAGDHVVSIAVAF